MPTDDLGGLELTMTTGACPVQIEGTFRAGGQPRWLYFRARGSGWSLDLYDSEPTLLSDEPPSVRHQGDYGAGPYDAGWMPHDEAEELCREGVRRYLAGDDWPQPPSRGIWLLALMVDEWREVHPVGSVVEIPVFAGSPFRVVEHWRSDLPLPLARHPNEHLYYRLLPVEEVES